ncbi:MAG TPA: ABC transporter ATP-binding protein [Streptosporangiaceae bacterium]|nr:ABC transporter ATP-binding protein [Streptosporangiaceae bacterium]
MAADPALLEVQDLTVSFGKVRAVENVSLSVGQGRVYGLVGESGCGKSTLAYALLGLVAPPGRIVSGAVRFRGQDLARMSYRELRRLRARHIAVVFQAAMSAFNPVISIGAQVEHILDAHPGVYPSHQAGREYFEELLRLVRLRPEQVWRTYESRLSGGMKQRVAIAFALLLKPEVLVLDEPTTALDVLSQRLVIDIVRDLHQSLDTTVVFVTHDLAVVAELAERVAVMYAGRLVESGTVEEIFFDDRRHPYVKALISAMPSVAADPARLRPIPGQVPDLSALPPGCRFEPRCALAVPVCPLVEPELVVTASGHAVSCHVVNSGLGRDGGQ